MRTGSHWGVEVCGIAPRCLQWPGRTGCVHLQLPDSTASASLAKVKLARAPRHDATASGAVATARPCFDGWYAARAGPIPARAATGTTPRAGARL